MSSQNRITQQEWRERAQNALGQGRGQEAHEAIAAALRAFPQDASLCNSFANMLMKAGDVAGAEAKFAQACTIDPQSLQFALNHAIALNAQNKFSRSLAILAVHDDAGAKSAAYCSTRGTAERGFGNKGAAAQWYDRAIALDPKRVRALHGRARVALERAEPEALQHVDRAMAVNPGEADLWLARAQALDVMGEVEGARKIAQQLVEQLPHWTEALKFLAQLRIAAGEKDYTAHYAEAAKRVPQDPNIVAEWAAQLAGLDHNAEAAEIAAHARKTFPDIEHFAFLQGLYAGAAGDDESAEKIFSTIGMESAERRVHEARHCIRTGQFERAEAALDAAIALEPGRGSAWAMRGIVWRLRNDPRAQWLHEQSGLVTLLPLDGADTVLPPVIDLLHQLHNASPFPLGQSLRGGTQTRGRLFERVESEYSALHQAIITTLETYRENLPAADHTHPLLKHKDTAWQIAGSWSVRLQGGGGDHHTSHIHPEGLLSSALYLDIPQAPSDDPQQGALEIGRPPKDLRLDLPPLQIIEPKTGHLALFPSTLYHGTRPFQQGARMTAAFDVQLKQEISQ